VQAGVASEEGIKEAAAEGLVSGELLGEVVVRKGWTTDERVAEVLADQWSLTYSTLEALPVEPGVRGRLPVALAREVEAYAFETENGMVAAIAEPSEERFASVVDLVGETSFVVVSASTLAALLADPDESDARPPAGSLAESVVEAIENSIAQLERARKEIVALGNSLEVARSQLADQEAELEALSEERDDLEQALTRQNDLFETLKGQVATLTDTLHSK